MPWSNQPVITPVIIIQGAGGGEFVYDAAGNLRSANVGGTTTDPLQQITCQQGISTFNGHGAVICLNATALDAELLYADTGTSTQGALIASDASANTTDPFGNTVSAGRVNYNLATSSVVQIAAGRMLVGSPAQIAGTSGKSPGVVGLISSAEGSLQLDSGLAGAGDADAFVQLLSKTANGGQRVVSAGGPLELSGESGSFPQQSQAALISNSVSGYPVVKPGLSGDTNAYRLGKIRAFNTADTAVGGLNSIGTAWNVVAGIWYEVHVYTIVTINVGATGTILIGFSKSGGAAVSDCRVQYKTLVESAATQSVVGTASDNTLGFYTTPSLNATNAYQVEGHGMVKFSAGGTVQFAVNIGTSAGFNLVHPSFATLEPDG